MGSTVQTLVERLRARSDDWGGDGDLDHIEWLADDTHAEAKTADLITYVADAQREFCRRNWLTSPLAIELVTGTSSYSLPSYYRALESVTLDYDDRELIKVYHHDVALLVHADTYPGAYREDLQRKQLTVYPTPVVDGGLTCVMRHLPTATPTALSDELQVDSVHDDTLVLWALSMLYSSPDAHPQAIQWASFFRQRFEDIAGPIIDERLAQVNTHIANKRLRVRTGYR